MNDSLISTDTPVDLTNCDREPIHLLGNVQPFGALIAVSSDWLIQHASANIDKITGTEAGDMIGAPLASFLPATSVEKLRRKLSASTHENAVTRLFGFPLFSDSRLFDISIHQSGQSYVFEFEAKARGREHDELALVTPMLQRISAESDIVSSADQAARQLRALSGFDRVMVYRFGPEGDGKVIAEAKDKADDETYFGLQFPASDIPRQARALYKKNLLRLISDVDATVSPIVPQTSPEGEPLDLSMAVTRAVSPIHLEYLRNMKVKASMSVSIVIRGELWGLFACHHREPLYIDYERRTAIELFAQFYAYELERQESRTTADAIQQAQRLHDRIMMQVSSGDSLISAFPTMAREIAKTIPYDGIALYSDGAYLTEGSTPEKVDFQRIARFLNTAAASRVYATDHLAARMPSIEAFQDTCAGVLAIPISRRPRDYIVLFRREIAHQVKWAGNPHKPVDAGAFGARLTPRKSFDVWKEDVANRSEQWSPTALRAAEAIRVTLLEVVLKLADEANVERKRAQDQQELLIAELNHRVRNVLGLIRSLVSQSRKTTTSIDDFTRAVDGRIHALAQAHDQLTATEWRPVALRELLAVEFSAYVANQADRLVVTGPVLLLAPEAFSTMALVFHELVTNSVKYGALSSDVGRVDVTVSQDPDGYARIKWVESGGPSVQAPTRRGFGSTIIEKSVGFELKGTSDIHFAMSGLRAEFTLPERTVEFRQLAPLAPEGTAVTAPLEKPQLSGVAMVVEDNMIIAMDASEILSELGADTVHVASSVAEALRIASANTLSLAVLDVNLGSETSQPVAEYLSASKVPFVLASGYSGAGTTLSQFPPAPVVSKPFTIETLSRGLSKLDLKGTG